MNKPAITLFLTLTGVVLLSSVPTASASGGHGGVGIAIGGVIDDVYYSFEYFGGHAHDGDCGCRYCRPRGYYRQHRGGYHHRGHHGRRRAGHHGRGPVARGRRAHR